MQEGVACGIQGESVESISYKEVVIYGFIILGIVFELFLMYKNHLAKNWDQTEGELVSSKVGLEHSGSIGLIAKVSYKYAANGQEFQSNRIAYATLGSGFALFRSFYLNKDSLTVYYNSQKPELAVILPGVRLFHILDIAFLVGIAYYIYAVIDL